MENQSNKQEFAAPPFRNHLIMIGVMWLICLVQLGLVKLVFKDLTGAVFFYFFIGIIFTIIAIYDWLYDRFLAPRLIEQDSQKD